MQTHPSSSCIHNTLPNILWIPFVFLTTNFVIQEMFLFFHRLLCALIKQTCHCGFQFKPPWRICQMGAQADISCMTCYSASHASLGQVYVLWCQDCWHCIKSIVKIFAQHVFILQSTFISCSWYIYPRISQYHSSCNTAITHISDSMTNTNYLPVCQIYPILWICYMEDIDFRNTMGEWTCLNMLNCLCNRHDMSFCYTISYILNFQRKQRSESYI